MFENPFKSLQWKNSEKSIDTMEIRMHGAVTVGSKWQIVIPKEVRNMLDLNEWDNLLAITKYGKFVGFIKTDKVEEFIELLKAETGVK